MDNPIKNLVNTTIDANKNALNELSQDIWSHPELAYDEYYGHDRITKFLENYKFLVEKKTPLETSFIARYPATKLENHYTVGLLCEYDALPGIGHACGHNLITEIGVAAAIGLKAAIEEHGLDIYLKVIGTPAEECYGGKIELIKRGVFDDCDICLMAHPAGSEVPRPVYLAKSEVDFIFKGKLSHASAAPWEGKNALDAAVALYNGVSMLRQQMKPTSRVHCVFKDGGKANEFTIPDRAELSFFIRGVTTDDLTNLKEKVFDCAKGAALQADCELEIKNVAPDYLAVNTNETLISLFVDNAKSLGTAFNDPTIPSGSTDMGNVSEIVPSIHPKFKITAKGPIHSAIFTEASGSYENQLPTLRCAKAIAFSVIDVAQNETLKKSIAENFKLSGSS